MSQKVVRRIFFESNHHPSSSCVESAVVGVPRELVIDVGAILFALHPGRHSVDVVVICILRVIASFS